MVWYIVLHLFSALVDWFRIGRLKDREKDLEILILRQQLGITERKLHKPVRVSRVERLTLAVLTTKMRSSANCTIEQLRQSIRIFQPKTVLDWHRQLVKRKWTYNPTGRGGRPRIDRGLESLVVRLAQENDDFGYDRIQGELEKLGYTISDEGVANILRRHNIPPAPERGGWYSLRELERLKPGQRIDLHEKAVDLVQNFANHWQSCHGDIDAQHVLIKKIVKRIYVSDRSITAATLHSNCHLILDPKTNRPTAFTVDPFP